jgi:hypothetical protein
MKKVEPFPGELFNKPILPRWSWIKDLLIANPSPEPNALIFSVEDACSNGLNNFA